ncbi:MAG: hypothetical protein K1X92_01050 [Bacteroidia bacterium]|nr:hypothetical protein [Bacteroidia bacterium]
MLQNYKQNPKGTRKFQGIFPAGKERYPDSPASGKLGADEKVSHKLPPSQPVHHRK